MKILFFTAGTKTLASTRIRVYQYFPYLEEAGMTYRCINYNSEKYGRGLLSGHEGVGRIRDILEIGVHRMVQILRFILLLPFYDICFIQKILLPIPVQGIVKYLNKNIIFDFDDAIYSENVPSYYKEKRSKTRIRLAALSHQLTESKYVLLTNRYAADYARRYNPNINIITGPVDTKRYYPLPVTDQPKKEITIGWIGSPSTAAYLEPLKPVFKKLIVKYPDLKIVFIGASGITMGEVNVVFEKWEFGTEVENLQKFDIGIMPLPDNEWTRGKGGYKLLQYMACGIPGVVSPVGINTEIIEDGINGFLAGSQEEWIDKISLLAGSPGLRSKIGREARDCAEKKYSLDVCAPILKDIFMKVAGNE